MKVVICRVNNEFYAIDIQYIVSIERMKPIRPIPESKPYFLGLVELRDEIIPIISLKKWLGLNEDIPSNEEERIILVEAKATKVGLHVDAATDVIEVEDSDIQKSDGNFNKEVISGVIRREGKLILLFEPKNIVL